MVPMIQLEKLTKEYKSVKALRGVDLTVERGELFAYLGPNGAGKTTTIRILTGLTRLGSGNAWLAGHHVEKEGLAAKRTCGLVPQSINLDQELSVWENLDIHGRLFHMPAAKRAERSEALLGYVGLLERKHSIVKTLSGGMRRRLMIARALLHEPGILFLDEPTVGLDAAIRRRIWALIKKIQRDGTTIFLTTHYIEEAEFLAGRVAFLDEGAVVAVDTPSALMGRLGNWAVDTTGGDRIETRYFKEHGAALEHLAGRKGQGGTVRRVNLEDAFLALTGKKVKGEA